MFDEVYKRGVHDFVLDCTALTINGVHDHSSAQQSSAEALF
jgi:hypothetical protein